MAENRRKKKIKKKHMKKKGRRKAEEEEEEMKQKAGNAMKICRRELKEEINLEEKPQKINGREK